MGRLRVVGSTFVGAVVLAFGLSSPAFGQAPPAACVTERWQEPEAYASADSIGEVRRRLRASQPAETLTEPAFVTKNGATIARTSLGEYRYSPLGYCGPLGPFGPLGFRGPLGPVEGKAGFKPTSVAEVNRAAARVFGPWFLALSKTKGWDATRTEGKAGQEDPFGPYGPLGPNGPLHLKGPLGPDGPLGSSYCALGAGDLSLSDSSPTKHLQAGGVWAVLGPTGPLGPLGPLGALGPLGPGYLLHEDGAGDPRRIPGVLYDRGTGQPATVHSLAFGPGNQRRYEWVEFYPGETARNPAVVKDSSFVTQGRIDDAGQADSYRFTSHAGQFVTVTVVPGNPEDAYGLEAKLTLPDGTAPGPIRSTNSQSEYVNHLHVRVPKGTLFELSVTRQDPAPGERPPDCPWSYLRWSTPVLKPMGVEENRGAYRLVVVGSTEAFGGTDIRGMHLLPLRPLPQSAAAQH